MDDYITHSDFIEGTQRLFDKLEEGAETLEKKLRALADTLESYEIEDAIEKTTHLFALEHLSNVYEPVVNMAVYAACMETKEYNFEPYVNQLISAINLNKDNGIIIMEKPQSFSKPHIKVDFSCLGTIDEWAKAVESARATLNMGKLRYRDISVASEKWKRYIYQVDREGKSVTRRKKNKETGKVEEIDVTDKYRGKYIETILTRLQFVAANKAPYWYLIEHGNATGTMEDEGGIPYPSFGPTRMTREIKIALEREFSDAYIRFQEVAEKILNETVRKDFDLELGDYEQIDDDMVLKIDDDVQKIIDEEAKSIPEFTGKGALKSVKKLRFINGQIDQYYSSKGNQLERFHDSLGRFTKVIRE